MTFGHARVREGVTVGLRRAVDEHWQRAAAGSTAALLALGLVAALAVDPSDGPQQVRTMAPTTTTSEVAAPAPATADETTTTVAAPEPAPASASASVTSVVAAAPAKPRTTTTKAPKASKEADYPGSVSFPFQAGRTSWSGTSNGFDMAVTVDKATPKNGEAVTFTVSLTNATRKCCGVALVYGDGGPFFLQDANCPGESATAGRTVTTKATRSYNKPGRWRFTLTGLTLDCHPDPAAQGYNGYLYGWIEVAPGGATTSQGPSLPAFRNVGRYGPTQYDNDPSYVTVFAQVSDVDGYISKLLIDYGDGATETIPETAMGCRQSDGGWPKESFMQTPNNPPPTHQYAARGTYKVTVTAFSQGCDGRDVQQASASFDWTY